MIKMYDRIKNEIQNYFKTKNSIEEFIPGKTKITLAAPSYDSDEVLDVLDSLLSTWLTMGDKVNSFEDVL